MDILDTETIAGTQHGGSIVRLVDIFEDYAYMACTQGCETVEEGAFVIAKEFCCSIIKMFFLFDAEVSERRGSVGIALGHV
jgi:hypothetical protein